jgi:hypothetical protein
VQGLTSSVLTFALNGVGMAISRKYVDSLLSMMLMFVGRG